jgi:hypothetical protein
MNGHSSLRLKAHQIMELITNYYVQYGINVNYNNYYPRRKKGASFSSTGKMNKTNERYKSEHSFASDLDYGFNKESVSNLNVDNSTIIRRDRLYLIQTIISVVKNSFENHNDSYLHFNSLILLDSLFQNIMPVPSYSTEILKVNSLTECVNWFLEKWIKKR